MHRVARTSHSVRLAGAIALLAVASAPRLLAHDFTVTATHARFAADGTFRIDMTCDLDALALGADPLTAPSRDLVAILHAMNPAELEHTITQLRRLFSTRVRTRFDGVAAPFEVDFPDYGKPTPPTLSEPTVLGVTARLTGRVPEGSRHFTFVASRAFQAVHLTLSRDDSPAIVRQILSPSDESAPYPLMDAVTTPTRLSIIGQYFLLGFEHILPKGFDHILFVLGLFLLSTRTAALLWQVTAFTAAHTLTLALATVGVVRLPPEIVEPLIALSIAYVGVENVLTPKLHAWRPALVFGFGLLHGMGFAGVLSELGLPEGQFTAALLSFNVGVETGQLAVITLAFALVGWWRGKAWYRKAVVVPASITVAIVGAALCAIRVGQSLGFTG